MQCAIRTAVLVFLIASPLAFAGQPAKTMTVFVTAGRLLDFGEVTKAERQQHESAIRAAQAARRDVDNALKAQHGSKRDRWRRKPCGGCRKLTTG